MEIDRSLDKYVPATYNLFMDGEDSGESYIDPEQLAKQELSDLLDQHPNWDIQVRGDGDIFIVANSPGDYNDITQIMPPPSLVINKDDLLSRSFVERPFRLRTYQRHKKNSRQEDINVGSLELIPDKDGLTVKTIGEVVVEQSLAKARWGIDVLSACGRIPTTSIHGRVHGQARMAEIGSSTLLPGNAEGIDALLRMKIKQVIKTP